MAYTDLTTLKAYAGVTNTTDDTLLTAILSRAIAAFDSHFDHRFEATTATRYYGSDAVVGSVLWLDAPLLTVTTLTNGDTDATGISSSDYWLKPRNRSPYWYIELKAAGTVTGWDIATDKEISVAGTWGYTATAPGEVVQAVLRLATYIYRQKDSQVFETTAVPELGVITIPSGIPQDVKNVIDTMHARYDLS